MIILTYSHNLCTDLKKKNQTEYFLFSCIMIITSIFKVSRTGQSIRRFSLQQKDVIQWRPCINLDVGINLPQYEVSNMGEIRNKKGRILKATIHNGYKRVYVINCRKERKGMAVHRIVCAMFNKQLDSSRQIVHHKNHDRLDNSASNLEWTTQSQNILHFHSQSPHKGRHALNQICTESGIVLKQFDSIGHASEFLSISRWSIIKALAKKKVDQGYSFEAANRSGRPRIFPGRSVCKVE